MRLDNEKPSDNVEDHRGSGGMGGGFGFPRGGSGGGFNIPMGGRGGGISLKTIIMLVIIYFAVKMIFGVDLLQVINGGGVQNPGGTDTQITLPDTTTSVTDAGDTGGGTTTNDVSTDAGKEFVAYKGRVYDIHLKDKKTEKTADGKSVILDVMVGTGDANYKGLLAELKKAKWPGVMAIETDNATFAKEPSEFVAGAIKFVKDNAK